VGRVVERGATVEQYASLEAGARALSGAVSRSLVMDEAVLIGPTQACGQRG